MAGKIKLALHDLPVFLLDELDEIRWSNGVGFNNLLFF